MFCGSFHFLLYRFYSSLRIQSLLSSPSDFTSLAQDYYQSCRPIWPGYLLFSGIPWMTGLSTLGGYLPFYSVCFFFHLSTIALCLITWSPDLEMCSCHYIWRHYFLYWSQEVFAGPSYPADMDYLLSWGIMSRRSMSSSLCERQNVIFVLRQKMSPELNPSRACHRYIFILCASSSTLPSAGASHFFL